MHWFLLLMTFRALPLQIVRGFELRATYLLDGLIIIL
jgi:hypothetical protein